MESGERNHNPYGRIQLRFCVYAAILALTLVFPIVELKTGVPLGRYRSTARYHDPLSWEEVLTQLPATLVPHLIIALAVFAIVEWFIRRKMKGAPSILDAEDETNDSPAKRFTGPWRVATIAYFASAVIALYVYSKVDWAWDMPLLFPLAVFAPIFVSLGLLAMYTDEFQLGVGGRTFYFYRNRNPIKYWVCVATILSIGIVLFAAGIGVIAT